MKTATATMLIAGGALLGWGGAALAGPDITQAVSQECRWDYHTYCSDYGIGSSLLSFCFRKNAKSLSVPCVKALIAAGDVSKAYVMQEKKALGR
jgi:hypothetical protein